MRKYATDRLDLGKKSRGSWFNSCHILQCTYKLNAFDHSALPNLISIATTFAASKLYGKYFTEYIKQRQISKELPDKPIFRNRSPTYSC